MFPYNIYPVDYIPLMHVTNSKWHGYQIYTIFRSTACYIRPGWRSGARLWCIM